MMAKKILIVDDEPHILMMVSSRLKAGGYEVITASDGKSGLALARAENPDLVLLDIMMPGVDGYEVCSELKHDERFQKIPVILFTAKASEEDERIGIEDCGADAYLKKPFDPNSLLEKVAELLG
jgi:DNA-binding response OmpR family regulator